MPCRDHRTKLASASFFRSVACRAYFSTPSVPLLGGGLAPLPAGTPAGTTRYPPPPPLRWGRSQKSAGTGPANRDYTISSVAGPPGKKRPAPLRPGKSSKFRMHLPFCLLHPGIRARIRIWPPICPLHPGKLSNLRMWPYCSRKARTRSPKMMGSFVRRFSTRKALR